MLDGAHYSALFLAYAAAMAGATVAIRLFPRFWPRSDGTRFAHPWSEFAYALVAAVGVVLVGQLYQRGFRLPTRGSWGTLEEVVNQAVIFSPMVLLLIMRRHSPETAWLPLKNAGIHFVTGLLLAFVAIVVFTTVREGVQSWHEVIGRVSRPANADKLVQVFLEDMAIAILLVRLGAALRGKVIAVILVAFLFSAGHIPAMLSKGACVAELGRLLLDFALAAFVLITVQRTSSIWWFVWVHFAMDMMQFEYIIRQAANVETFLTKS